MVRIVFFVTEQDREWSNCVIERMWATQVDELEYRLENSPQCIRNIAYKDIVFAAPSVDFSGQVQFLCVSERSGHSTFWCLLAKTSSTEGRLAVDQLLSELEDLGVTWEESNIRSYSFDIPPDIDRDHIRRVLDRAEHDGLLVWLSAFEPEWELKAEDTDRRT